MENQNVASKEKEHMQTLVSCLNYLLVSGFATQFKAISKGLLSLTTQKTFQPDDVKVVQFYRFEGESNPSDSAIVYAIEATDGEKGTLVDGYGTSSDSQVTNFMKEVKIIHK